MQTILGEPIPRSEHAVSVCLPTLGDVIGYEEGHKSTCEKIIIGYPRFKIHIYIETLCSALLLRRQAFIPGDYSCMVFPTIAVALRFQQFLMHEAGSEEVILEPIDGTEHYTAFYSSSLASKAKAYWQHTGEIFSSRQALKTLNHLNISKTRVFLIEAETTNDQESIVVNPLQVEMDITTVKERIARILDEPNIPGAITLTVTGMASLFTALRLTQELDRINQHSPGKIVVFGFPYLDTLKMMSRMELNPAGEIFLGMGNETDLESLSALLEEHNGQDDSVNRISAIFTEFPSNPLLKCPDIVSLSRLADKYNVLLVVDDTIAGFSSVDLLHKHEDLKVDILCSSLTKLFSGAGDVVAGSLVINSTTKSAGQLRDIIISNSLQLPSLSADDAAVLESNSRDYLARATIVNVNAMSLAMRLDQDPRIKEVNYPGLSVGSKNIYDHCSRTWSQMCLEQRAILLENSIDNASESNDIAPSECDIGSNYGCLLSFVLEDTIDFKTFYDCLRIRKGPSLGTNFTLVCTYTLLAHYNELEWARQYGVNSEIIRVSVGLENFEDIWSAFSQALEEAHVRT